MSPEEYVKLEDKLFTDSFVQKSLNEIKDGYLSNSSKYVHIQYHDDKITEVRFFFDEKFNIVERS